MLDPLLLWVYSFSICFLTVDCGCHWNSQPNTKTFVRNEAEPVYQHDEHLLNNTCPMLLKNGYTGYCCDETLLSNLKERLNTLQVIDLEECRKKWQFISCWLSCSPFQDRSIYVERNESNPNFVTKVILYMDTKSLSDIYDACKYATITNLDLPQIICGDAYESTCSETAESEEPYFHQRNYVLNTINFDISSTNSADDKYDIILGETNSTYHINGTCLYPFSFESALLTTTALNMEKLCKNKTTTTVKDFKTERVSWNTVKSDALTFAAVRKEYVFWLIFAGATLLVTGIYIYVVLKFEKKNPENQIKPKKSKFAFSTYTFEKTSKEIFYRIGEISSHYRVTVISIAFICCCLLSLGVIKFGITNDALTLWSMANGKSIQEKDLFESTFKPFHRITQVYLLPKKKALNSVNTNISNSMSGYETQQEVMNTSNESIDIFEKQYVHEVKRLHEFIANIKGFLPKRNITVRIEEVCFKPMDPMNKNCTIMSIKHWLNKEDEPDNVDWCAQNPMRPFCTADYGIPMMQHQILAGRTGRTYKTAKAFVITVVLNNPKDYNLKENVLAWEKSFLNEIKNISSKYFDVFYLTERSIEDELTQSSRTDIISVITSYVVMFVYISLFIGTYRSLRTFFVDVKLTIGLTAIITVLLSAVTSASMISLFKYKTTLIILQVVPFLLMAVGSGDNFIFVKSYLRCSFDEKSNVERKVAMNTKEVGPSLFLSSACQAIAFASGMLVPTYAVRVFAFYSAIAVIVKFLLQITMFVSIFTIDAKRRENCRLDILYCIKQKKRSPSSQSRQLIGPILNRLAEFLTLKYVSQIILFLFSAGVIASIYFCKWISVGFDQKIVLQDDSYVAKFLNVYEKLGEAGAPVYFVLNGDFDYMNSTCLNLIDSRSTNGTESFSTTVRKMTKRKNSTYLTAPILWWYPEFKIWMKERYCCSCYKDSIKLCAQPDVDTSKCHACFDELSEKNIAFFVQRFLKNENSTHLCNMPMNLLHKDSIKVNLTANKIEASLYMAFHTALKSSYEYITAMKITQQLASELSKTLISHGCFKNVEKNHGVFAYSPFYVYYEQYFYLPKFTVLALLSAVTGIFLITLVILGFDFHSAFIVLVTLVSSLLALFGAMGVMDIELNAVSVVNIVMSVGIMVEFYVHITRHFATSDCPTRKERVRHCLRNVGSDVLVGITIPEILSISTMAFAKSKLFRIYFFQLYFALIVISTLHAFLLLPSLLYLCAISTRILRVRKVSQPMTETFCTVVTEEFDE